MQRVEDDNTVYIIRLYSLEELPRPHNLLCVKVAIVTNTHSFRFGIIIE